MALPGEDFVLRAYRPDSVELSPVGRLHKTGGHWRRFSNAQMHVKRNFTGV